MTKFEEGDVVKLSGVGLNLFEAVCSPGKVICIGKYRWVRWADGRVGLHTDEELMFVSKELQIESWLKDNA